jgi:hypothetical protein
MYMYESQFYYNAETINYGMTGQASAGSTLYMVQLAISLAEASVCTWHYYPTASQPLFMAVLAT